jgi:phosphate transport system permease protein
LPEGDKSGRATFTGRRRTLKTPFRVKFGERAARVLVSIGGYGTITAVLVILVVLGRTVVPLFSPARIEKIGVAPVRFDETPVVFGTDDYGRVLRVVAPSGVVEAFSLEDGARIFRLDLFPESKPSCAVDGATPGRFGFGFDDGSVRFGAATFVYETPAEGSAEAERFGDLAIGAVRVDGEAVVERLRDGSLRRTSVAAALEEPLKSDVTGRVVLLDESFSPGRRDLATFRDDGSLTFATVEERTNMMTGEVRRVLEESVSDYRAPIDGPRPSMLRLASHGSVAYLVWTDGRCVRFDLRNAAGPKPAEALDLVVAPGASLTDLRFVLGGETLVASDSLGRSASWYCVKPPDADTSDGAILRSVKSFERTTSPASASARSSRGRLFALGHADGTLRVLQTTTTETIVSVVVEGGGPIRAVAFSPKNDALVAATDRGVVRYELHAEEAEATPAALFTGVAYEGYAEPEHVWQSSSGSDEFEPKFGVLPLVFGTLKGAFVALLLSLPIALPAAIYASEFLTKKAKARVKPTIELMASLPSVVLGFIGAMVLAPFTADRLAAVIAGFYVIPVCLLFGAAIWQMAPERVTRSFGDRLRLPAVALACAAAIALAGPVGRVFEIVLFGGDVKRWLDGGPGGAFGGWFLILLAPSAFVVALVFSRRVAPWLRAVSSDWTRSKAAAVDAAKLAAGLVAAALLSAAVAALLSAASLDARGALVGQYVQRNALVVGFVMGFAVVPIIFTLAEDALSSVPESLRSASLGAGATPWQTATRIVVPTAMSGLFSAVMVGVGRAVGETMIVLMAAGNTPLMDLNPFNGFRTLAANLAYELPEAPHGSPHYRVLFLTALALFAMTFVVNTVAEVVRRRFRKRAFQL